MPSNDDFVTKDVLIGAGPLAKDVFGADTPENRRKIYHLHAERVLPTWMFGGRLAATRTALRSAIAELANAARD